MAQMEIPGVLVTIVLQPLAKILNIKYIPKSNNRLLLKKIFEKIASKAKKLDTGTFQKIIAHLEDIISPVSSVMSMFAVMIRPLISVIPPQYLIIVVAVLLLAFVMYFFVYPAAFLGLFVAYHAEKMIKVPFNNLSMRKRDAILPNTYRDQFIVKKTEKKTITTTLVKFLELPLQTQYDYLYENNLPASYLVIAKIYNFLPENLRTVVTLQDIIQNPEKYGVDPLMVQGLVNALLTSFTLTATFYSGMRRVFPPILNRIVTGIKGLTLKMEDSSFVKEWMRQANEHPLQALFFPLITTIRASNTGAFQKLWKPDPNV